MSQSAPGASQPLSSVQPIPRSIRVGIAVSLLVAVLAPSHGVARIAALAALALCVFVHKRIGSILAAPAADGNVEANPDAQGEASPEVDGEPGAQADPDVDSSEDSSKEPMLETAEEDIQSEDVEQEISESEIVTSGSKERESDNAEIGQTVGEGSTGERSTEEVSEGPVGGASVTNAAAEDACATDTIETSRTDLAEHFPIPVPLEGAQGSDQTVNDQEITLGVEGDSEVEGHAESSQTVQADSGAVPNGNSIELEKAAEHSEAELSTIAEEATESNTDACDPADTEPVASEGTSEPIGPDLWQLAAVPMCVVSESGEVLQQNEVSDFLCEESESDTVWEVLCPEPEEQAELLKSLQKADTIGQVIVERAERRYHIHSVPLPEGLHGSDAWQIAWTSEAIEETPDPVDREALSDLLETAQELSHVQDRWHRQSEKTKTLLEDAWQGWESSPRDREAWAEGSARWQQLMDQCQEISTKLHIAAESTVEQMQNMRQPLEDCQKAGEQVGAVVPALLGFADQANLLAFNATIEAASADTDSRGFARIAGDIRDLAQDGSRKGQGSEAMRGKLAGSTALLCNLSQALQESLGAMHEHAASLQADFAEQQEQARELVRQGCKEGDSAIEMGRALQVVVEANRVQSTLSRSLSQSILSLEKRVQGFAESCTEDSQDADGAGGDSHLRIVA